MSKAYIIRKIIYFILLVPGVLYFSCCSFTFPYTIIAIVNAIHKYSGHTNGAIWHTLKLCRENSAALALGVAIVATEFSAGSFWLLGLYMGFSSWPKWLNAICGLNRDYSSSNSLSKRKTKNKYVPQTYSYAPWYCGNTSSNNTNNNKTVSYIPKPDTEKINRNKLMEDRARYYGRDVYYDDEGRAGYIPDVEDVTLFYDYCDDPVTKEIRGTALMDAMDDPFANDEDWTDVF